jgi:GTPase
LSGFERDTADDVARGARALIICPDIGRSNRDTASRLEEAQGLALAIGLQVEAATIYRVRTAKPATLLGSGQVQEIGASVAAHEASLVIVDGALTPVQQRNLEKAWNAKVIDRTGLILEIFGERAVSAEGRLQVELAHLDYQAGRLVRSWTHLERQRGGFGFLGGPGETQIEADRRLIRDRMARLRRELEKVRRTRGLHRSRRHKAPWPVVALAGYTNAGKSTLFNRLTGADVVAEDLLFATLDPTMREIALPGLGKAIISDTVGFVSDLPTELVAAFRATLEEVNSADLILHIRDISHPDSEAQAADVRSVLKTIFEGEGDQPASTPPMVEIWNKADALDAESRADIESELLRRDDAILVSALTGEGMEALRRFVADRLTKDHQTRLIHLPLTEGANVAWLRANGDIVSEVIKDDVMTLEVRLSDLDYGRFQARLG